MKRLIVFAICNILLLISGQPGHAADYVIFGLELFKTSKGKPYTQESTFSSRITGPQAKLVIVNGDETGKHRVSSGSIILNGKEIVSPSDFNQKVAQIERPVTLELTNKLSVKLASAPDNNISVRIIGNYPAPTITIMSPLDQDVVLSPTTLVRGRVETAAEYVEISVNGERALMSGKEFFVNALPLSQGENTITVVMEDSNRMAAQTEVTVFSEQGVGNIELALDEPGGFAPLDTKLTAVLNLSSAVVEDSAALVCDGPDQVSITPLSITEYSLHFDAVGLYACNFSITDIQGVTHGKQTLITIFEPFNEAQWLAMQAAVQDLEDMFKSVLTATDITTARQKVLQRALENPVYTNVTLSAGALCLVYQGKIPIILDLPDPNGPVTEGSGGSISSQSMDTQASVASLAGDSDLKYPGNDKVLMYAPGYSGWGTGDYNEAQDLIADDAVDFFEGAKSYSAHLPMTLLQDHQASVEAVKRFDKYGTVIINTHGWWWKYISGDIYGDDIPNYEGPIPGFRTGTVYSSDNILEDKYDTDLLLHRLAISKKPKGGNFHYVVFPSFINRYVSKLPDTFFYLGYCSSLQNDKMWNVLKRKGAKVSFGFSEEVLLSFDANKFEELMSLMLSDSVSREPLTAREAYNAISNKTDTGHIGARFEMRVASSEWNNFIYKSEKGKILLLQIQSSKGKYVWLWDLQSNSPFQLSDQHLDYPLSDWEAYSLLRKIAQPVATRWDLLKVDKIGDGPYRTDVYGEQEIEVSSNYVDKALETCFSNTNCAYWGHCLEPMSNLFHQETTTKTLDYAETFLTGQSSIVETFSANISNAYLASCKLGSFWDGISEPFLQKIEFDFPFYNGGGHYEYKDIIPASGRSLKITSNTGFGSVYKLAHFSGTFESKLDFYRFTVELDLQNIYFPPSAGISPYALYETSKDNPPLVEPYNEYHGEYTTTVSDIDGSTYSYVLVEEGSGKYYGVPEFRPLSSRPWNWPSDYEGDHDKFEGDDLVGSVYTDKEMVWMHLTFYQISNWNYHTMISGSHQPTFTKAGIDPWSGWYDVSGNQKLNYQGPMNAVVKVYGTVLDGDQSTAQVNPFTIPRLTDLEDSIESYFKSHGDNVSFPAGGGMRLYELN